MERLDIKAPDGTILFKHEELQCPSTGTVKLADGFAEALMGLRLNFDAPMIVNSCCRSRTHNQTIGGHPHSLHVWDKPFHPVNGCAAIDFRPGDAVYNARLVFIALSTGWSVGVGRNKIHLDRRDYAKLNQGLFGY